MRVAGLTLLTVPVFCPTSAMSLTFIVFYHLLSNRTDYVNLKQMSYKYRLLVVHIKLPTLKYRRLCRDTCTHTFYGPLSRTTRVSRYQEGKTNLDVTEARDTDNHASIQPLSFLQAGCPSCYPTSSVKALKAIHNVCK